MYNCDIDKRHIQAISFGQRLYGRQFKRYITLSEINTDEAEPGFYANNELNTRAKTICVGVNWRLLRASGQCCGVYGFHNNSEGIKYVLIARVATLIRDEHRRVRIMIVIQTLYSVAILDHSLINSNQIRNFGIPVSDYPNDSGRYFGINHDDQFIPFNLEG